MLITVTIGDIIFYTILIIVILVGTSIGIAMKVYELRDKYRAKKRKQELEQMGLLKKSDCVPQSEVESHFKNAVAAGVMQQSVCVPQTEKQDPPHN